MRQGFERDIEEVQKEFPCLQLKRNGAFWHLSGKLISQSDMRLLYLSREEVAQNDDIFEVLVVIPDDYKQVGCDIYDYNKMIDWSKIPYEHIHKNRKMGKELYALCTNVPNAIGEMINPILENLNTAYVLVTEYKRYERNGKYELEEYSHGEEGIKEYEQEKRRAK